MIADPTGVGVRRPIGTSGAADTPYVPGVDDPSDRRDGRVDDHPAASEC